MSDLHTTAGAPAQVWDTSGNLIWGGGDTPPGPPVIDLPPSPTSTTITTYVGDSHIVHPSVVDMGEEFGGYRWWLADTPYGSSGGGSEYENPCIWASNDYGITWEVPSGVTNPLEPWPGGPYNSDTELVWDPEGAQLVVYWRLSSREQVRYATSPDGHAWTVHGELFTPTDLAPTTGAHVSPTVVRVAAGDWRMWLFAENDPPHQYSAPAATGPWAYVGQATFSLATPAWHGDIILYKGSLIGVFGDRHGVGRAMLSNDGTDGMDWAIGPTSPNLAGYRSTLVPSQAPNTLDMWSGSIGQEGHVYRRVHESVWLGLA